MAEVESYKMEISWSKIQVMYTSKERKKNTRIIKKWKSLPLKSMDTASKQKISKETLTLNDITLDQMNLRDRYKTFYPKETEYTFLFLSTYGTFSRMDMLGHKISLNKLKRIEIK